jgi:hypothetical protein
MGAFFHGEYDLFSEIMKDPDAFMANSILSLRLADRHDLEDDVKDAVVEIVSCVDFSEARKAVSSLKTMLEDGFGISTTIEKRN